jgi:glycosyltransferase involved in cell wall biosynthesis
MGSEGVMVSVCMITYNHELYIKDAIDGVLAQKADFSFELVIGEDASTDGTRSLCEHYARIFPEKIRLLPSVGNKGMMKNFVDTFLACEGKYIALCEGDDYWTDVSKLQKQVDFLQRDASCSFSSHHGRDFYVKENVFVDPPFFKSRICFADFAVHRCMIHTMSVVLRNEQPLRELLASPWVLELSGVDLLIYLFMTSHGRCAYCFSESMGVYRVHPGGSWQGLTHQVRFSKAENDLVLYRDNLVLTSTQTSLMDWQLKGIISERIKCQLRNSPDLIIRIVRVFINRVMFAFGPGKLSSIVARILIKLV